MVFLLCPTRSLSSTDKGKRPLQRPRHKWKVDIKMYVRDIWYMGVDWTQLAQDRAQCRVLDLSVSWNGLVCIHRRYLCTDLAFVHIWIFDIFWLNPLFYSTIPVTKVLKGVIRYGKANLYVKAVAHFITLQKLPGALRKTTKPLNFNHLLLRYDTKWKHR